MPLAPWTQQITGALFGDEEEKPPEPGEKPIDWMATELANQAGVGLGNVGSWLGDIWSAMSAERNAVLESQARSRPTPVTPPINEMDIMGGTPYTGWLGDTTPATTPTTTPGLEPGGSSGTEAPQIVNIGGQQFYYDPINGWQPLGASPAQQADQAARERAAQIAQIQLQYQLSGQNAQAQNAQQAELQRQLQAAAAAQTMAQMYAADPYKYWAQLGQGTPGAVARLTRGKVKPGEPAQQVPLSIPSSQWWSNLLPSEQQQIMGGVNWLGVYPEDWYSTYQKMIPGLAARQVESRWAR